MERQDKPRRRVAVVTGRPRVAAELVRNIRIVFEDRVEIVKYTMPEIEKMECIHADAILVSKRGTVQELERKVSDMQKVILVTRTITTDALQKILSIPQGSRVLLVNDTGRTTAALHTLLRDLHIDGLDLVTYDPHKPDRSITIAITPDEVAFVPDYIRQIVNIGQRVPDMRTIFELSALLQIDLADISAGLMAYANQIVNPSHSSEHIYDFLIYSNYVQNMLRHMQQGLLLTRDDGTVMTANEQLEDLVGRKLRYEQDNLQDIFPERIAERLLAMGEESVSIDIYGREITVTHETIPYTGTRQNIYFFNDTTYVHHLERSLQAKAREKGFVAKHTFEDMIYRSEKMVFCVDRLRTFAASENTVLLQGETGTGKELLAQSIHNASPRRNGPFVAINCAALPESLLESELFGYEEGAFTGAKKAGRAGLFEQADGGTLFLDEIGDMPFSLQSRLLRVLQEMQVMRLGGSRMVSVNVRIIAATNQNLEAKIQDGSFRGDLYYRLNVLPCLVPPLRERREDILPLFLHFAQEEGVPPDIVRTLESHSWPGNVRELQNAASYYTTMRGSICPLPEHIRPAAVPAGSGRDAGIERLLLLALAQGNHGRGTLAEQLGRQGVKISEYELRRRLEDMERRGLLIRHSGRGGTRLSERGKAELTRYGG